MWAGANLFREVWIVISNKIILNIFLGTIFKKHILPFGKLQNNINNAGTA